MKIAYTKTTCLITLLTTILFICSTSLKAQEETDFDDNFARRASVEYQRGNWEEGKKIVDEGLKKHPDNSDLHMLSGKYFYEQKIYERARYELVEALKYNKNNSVAKQILINVEILTERYSSAICYINELLEINPYWKEYWRKKIDIYRLQGNHVEANRLLKRISQIYPDDLDIHNTYLYYIEQEAISEHNKGNLDRAIELSSALIKGDPYNEAFYIRLINNYLKSGEEDKAINCAEKGLNNIPGNINLIEKKADILGELHHYDEVLSFLKRELNKTPQSEKLQKKYDYYLVEAARHKRNSESYILYRKLYERNPSDEEIFNHIISDALSRGLYEDALDIVHNVKKRKGDTKKLLVKERHILALMGFQTKADAITVQLYERFPEDSDIKDEYVMYRLKQAKELSYEGIYNKALLHWQFVVDNTDADLRKTALSSFYNCAFQTGKYNEALNALRQLIDQYPSEAEWFTKRAMIYERQKRYQDAITDYAHAINCSPGSDRDHILTGYDEMAAACSKRLIEGDRLHEAMEIIEQWLKNYPRSETGVRYAINIAAEMNDTERMIQYARLGLRYRPEDTFCLVKLAEGYNKQKRTKESIELLSPEIAGNPYHRGLIGAYSQANEDYARNMIDEKKYNESLSALSEALSFDSDNRSLKYWKGITFEKLKMNDSAYYYQSFYEPSFIEEKEFENHLKSLKSKTFKNQVNLSYQRNRYNDVDVINSLSSAEYTRLEKKNIYTIGVNYAGRQNGKGIQGRLEWSHNWKSDLYTRLDAAIANKFFPSFMANLSAYKTFNRGWEAELGGGYRRLHNGDNMFNAAVGITKEFEPWILGGRFNSFILDGKYYYSASLQGRFQIPSVRSYILAMGSVGSAPDVDVVDNNLYGSFSATNSMVGLGFYYTLNEYLSLGLLGSLYNYKDKTYNFAEGSGEYRNLNNISMQLYVRF